MQTRSKAAPTRSRAAGGVRREGTARTSTLRQKRSAEIVLEVPGSETNKIGSCRRAEGRHLLCCVSMLGSFAARYRLNVRRIFGAPLAKGAQRLSQRSSPKRECPNHVVSDYFCHYEKLTRISSLSKLDFSTCG